MKRSISIDRILRNEFPLHFYEHFSSSFAMPDQKPGTSYGACAIDIVSKVGNELFAPISKLPSHSILQYGSLEYAHVQIGLEGA